MTACTTGRRPRRQVTDEEFRAAYYGRKGDPDSAAAAKDNRGVIRAVLRAYRDQVPAADLEAAGMNAMWRALQYHQTDHPSRQKFTTSLHRFATWECEREARNARGGRSKTRPKFLPLPGPDMMAAPTLGEEIAHVRECLGRLPLEWQRTVISQYYLEGMTLDEVGAANGYSKETARKRLRLAMEALRGLAITSLAVAWALAGWMPDVG